MRDCEGGGGCGGAEEEYYRVVLVMPRNIDSQNEMLGL